MKQAKKRKMSRPVIILIIFFLSLAIYFAYQLAEFFVDIREIENFEDEDDLFDDVDLEPKEKDPVYPRTNILLLGIDARSSNERSRADTIMVLSFDDKTREASLLSIPRDTRVNIPGRGLDKINHAHAFGGIPLISKAVEEFLDVPIHYYARINFEGFQKIIDSLGGVTIDVEHVVARSLSQISKKPIRSGVQKLDGETALMYVQHRKTDSDIGRVKRQQKFLKAVAIESLKLKTIILAPQILDSLGDNLRTNMPVRDMLSVANMFLKVDFDTIPQGVIPGRGQYIDKISYWIADLEETEELLQELGLKNHIP